MTKAAISGQKKGYVSWYCLDQALKHVQPMSGFASQLLHIHSFAVHLHHVPAFAFHCSDGFVQLSRRGLSTSQAEGGGACACELSQHCAEIIKAGSAFCHA